MYLGEISYIETRELKADCPKFIDCWHTIDSPLKFSMTSQSVCLVTMNQALHSVSPKDFVTLCYTAARHIRYSMFFHSHLLPLPSTLSKRVSGKFSRLDPAIHILCFNPLLEKPMPSAKHQEGQARGTRTAFFPLCTHNHFPQTMIAWPSHLL